MDAEGLEVSLQDMLKAFELALPHTAQNRSHKQYLKNRMDVALSIVDWAVMECDRGVRLLEMTAEMALKRRDDPPSNITIGRPLP